MLKILNKRMNSKGFTLIELLVVIAIIGILSSVVLVSLNTARNKAKDSAVKTALAEIRSVAEMHYDSTGGYNGADIAENVANIKTNNNNQNLSGDINEAQTQIDDGSGGLGTSYCIMSPLLGAGDYWCVDSNGASKASTLATDCADHVCDGS